jgi:L-rhamnose mutarotase
MTRFTEFIYNTFLRISRSRQGKPFRYRKDFSEFEKDPNYVYIVKLENFFKRFPHINIEEYFEAPYYVYPEQTYYGLDFYLSPKAIKVYTIFNKQRNDALPDSDLQLDFIKRSLLFIYNFCKERDIPLSEYIYKKNKLFPAFLLHLKEHQISIYTLFGWDKFEEVFSSLDKSEVEFIIGYLYDKLSTYRTQFIQSTKAKVLVKEGIKRLEKRVATADLMNK